MVFSIRAGRYFKDWINNLIFLNELSILEYFDLQESYKGSTEFSYTSYLVSVSPIILYYHHNLIDEDT